MSERNRDTVEFCYYAIPDREEALVFLGTDNTENTGKRKKHFHNLMEIAVCRSGSGQIITDDESYDYNAECIMIVPPNKIHAIISNSNPNSFWEYIYINPSVFYQYKGISDREKKFLQIAEKNFIFKKKQEIPFLAAEINLLMDYLRIRDFLYHECVGGLLYTMLMEIAKMNYELINRDKMYIHQLDNKSRHLAMAVEYIDENYHQKIQTKDIADVAFLSQSGLRKMFQEQFEMSPMQYVNYRRIQKACDLFKKADYNVTEVSEKVGYDNIVTFINNFRTYVGDSPKQWKKKQKK